MRNYGLILIVGLVALLSSCSQSTSGPKKAVYIIIDGVPSDMVERLDLPAIQEIASEGAYGRSYVGGSVGRYDETPTISAVGYTDLLTATWLNKHNVPGNDNLSPNYNYPTIFRIAKDQDREVTTAIFSSWIDNRTVLIGEGKAETRGVRLDYVYDGYELDKEKFPGREYDLRIFDIDEYVSERAAECIRENAPDLSWVYLWYTDDAGHIFGNGEKFDQYVRLADKQVERVWDAVKYRREKFGEDWMVVVTTDHGRTVDGHSHGGQTERERTTWVAVNKPVNGRMLSGKSAITDIAPSICRFLGFEIPSDVEREQDGISFYGKADIMDMDALPYDEKADLKWTCMEKGVQVNVLASVTNNFKAGGKDEWIEVGKALSEDESYTVDLKTLPKTGFYKFVLETPNSTLNRWMTVE